VSVLITNAKRLEAASLHFQVLVVEVDFADGTKWRQHEELTRIPIDSSLVDEDAGKCSDLATVVRSLRAIDGFTLGRGVEKPSYEQDEAAGSPPHLIFGCRIEGSKAVCPMS
jgi:hypothetical protein